jgi:hypothetical protein
MCQAFRILDGGWMVCENQPIPLLSIMLHVQSADAEEPDRPPSKGAKR